MPSLYRLLGLTPNFDFTRLTTSYILPPLVLGIIRLLIGLYAIATNIFKLILTNSPHSRERHWSYFTNITYWSLGFYFLFTAYHTLVYNAKGTVPLKRWGRPLQTAHLVLWTTVVVYPLLVTAVYWGILAPTDSPFASVYSGWSNISSHALNSAFGIFELFFSRYAPPPWFHLIPIILFLAGYLGIAYITYSTQGFYTYAFLNPQNGAKKLAIYIVGILVAVCVVFCIVWAFLWVKDWIAGKCRNRGLRSKMDKGDGDGERIQEGRMEGGKGEMSMVDEVTVVGTHAGIAAPFPDASAKSFFGYYIPITQNFP
ncbi:hypothetical protein BZA77DRAFT_292966 [Pyronema omphalodes]|nr:hypothetical protein BZA77DRAFT_292966 [Pyronema omphalodes]